MLSRSVQSIAPRGVRFVSTTVNRIATPAASSNNAKASITTTAASPGNPAPTASAYIVGLDGRLKSAHRQFHAAGSESAPGLNESVKSESSERLSARLQRMHDAKELAGMYN